MALQLLLQDVCWMLFQENWKCYFSSFRANCAAEFSGNSVPDFCRCKDAHGLDLGVAKRNGLTLEFLFGSFIFDLCLCLQWMMRVSSDWSCDPLFLSACAHSVHRKRGGLDTP